MNGQKLHEKLTHHDSHLHMKLAKRHHHVTESERF